MFPRRRVGPNLSTKDLDKKPTQPVSAGLFLFQQFIVKVWSTPLAQGACRPQEP
jgi:hypothetical protein